MNDLQKEYSKAMSHILHCRQFSPDCTICSKKLFDYMQCLDEYFYGGRPRLNRELIDKIYRIVFENYQFTKEDASLNKHHVSYEKNITIPVCVQCHKKIHSSSDPKYRKYYPVDKKGCC